MTAFFGYFIPLLGLAFNVAMLVAGTKNAPIFVGSAIICAGCLFFNFSLQRGSR